MKTKAQAGIASLVTFVLMLFCIFIITEKQYKAINELAILTWLNGSFVTLYGLKAKQPSTP